MICCVRPCFRLKSVPVLSLPKIIRGTKGRWRRDETGTIRSPCGSRRGEVQTVCPVCPVFQQLSHCDIHPSFASKKKPAAILNRGTTEVGPDTTREPTAWSACVLRGPDTKGVPSDAEYCRLASDRSGSGPNSRDSVLHQTIKPKRPLCNKALSLD